MDDLEFRRRAFANPHDQDPEFLAAAAASPERSRVLSQLQVLDERVSKAARSVPVPKDLAARLKAREVPAHKPEKTSMRRYFAVAASLIVAIGLILSPGLITARPSAADMKFHDDVIGHVYREIARYSPGLDDISLNQINSVLEETGGHLRDDDQIKQMHFKFANGCSIAQNSKGAHIVLDGSRGAVSVIVVHNSPVTTKFDVNDSRFAGKIIPFGEGNLIIVGEKDEPLDVYENMIESAFEWSR
ncbi:MAG: DUF3379 family protein [Pseudomonadales bacterium]|nr:DUF3379 family protein [Pseudomonadales bacterium]MCP5357039.1 DUF3379 family protein [Pseudomonadales bacterium]